jgi:hypothetical protein
MLVCPGVCNRNRRAILGNERFQLFNDVIRRENLGPDRQTGFFCKLFWRTTLNGPTKSFLNLMADDLAKAYHFGPRDSTLLWDRIPMAIGFMALVAATVGERISVKASMQILVPLMALGAASVAYWDVTQKGGHGDLRPYVLVQFGSVLVILLLVGLFPSRYTRGVDLVAALAIYVFAKIFEAADGSIFALGNIVSGHTLKHIAAAVSVYWILRMLRHRDVLSAQQRIRSTNE